MFQILKKITKVKSTVSSIKYYYDNMLLVILKVKKLLECFTKKISKKQIKNTLELKK